MFHFRITSGITNLLTIGRTPWTADQPDARPLPTQASTSQKDKTNIHTISGIRTHDLSDQAIKDYAQTSRPLGPAFLKMAHVLY
jgi:hypothetical protein